MSYVILKTDGTILTTITDGTINTTSTSIGLPGRLYPGYGQVVDTNFVHVIENFADAVPPPNPLQGQIWCDTSGASPVLRVCPQDGEANALNWYTVLTSGGTPSNIAAANLTATGNVSSNNVVASNVVSANLISTNYLTVNVQANIANANVTGNANLANVITNNITTGSTSTLGNITGAWTVNGSATLNSVTGTAMWVRNGNLLASGIKTDNWYYANGTAVSFDGTYSNSNVASYLPTYTGAVGAFGGGASFNGNVLSTGSNANAGTITGNWTLSPGSLINGLSNISGANIVGAVASATSATTAATVTNPIQSNITQVGTLASLTSSGLVTAQRFSATVANGTPPLVIQSTTKVANLNADLLDGYDTDTSASPTSIVVRDSSGNVTGNYIIGNGAFLTGLSTGSVSQITNGTSNIAVVSSGGNVAISIGGTANTAVFSSNGLDVVANVSANNVSANRLAGSLTTAAQPNITSVGTLTSLSASGNITGPNVVVNTGAFYGNAAGLTNIPAANLSGSVPTANYATYSGIITIGAQPNITSVGTLTSLSVSGKVTAGQLQGDGGNISNVPAANISGTVPSSTSATTAGTVTTAAQPNITSVSSSFSNLTFAANSTLNIPGTVSQITGANAVIANFFQGNGSRLSSITGANVTGQVSFAATANSVAAANVSGTVANATYATSAGSASTASTATTAGTVTTAAQPNITSVGSTLSIGGSQAVKLSDFTQSFGDPGWTRLPNGLIIQWGSFSAIDGATYVNFPISFTTASFTVVSGTVEVGNYGAQDNPPTVLQSLTSYFGVQSSRASGYVYYIAVGY